MRKKSDIVTHCYTTFLLFICRITSIQVFNVFICETLPIKSHRERPPPPLWPFPASAFIPTTPRPSSFPGRPFEFYRLGLQTCSYIYTVLWRMRLFLIFLVLVWRNIFLLSRKMVLWILSETHDILSSEMRWLIFVNINLVIYISKIRNFSNY